MSFLNKIFNIFNKEEKSDDNESKDESENNTNDLIIKLYSNKKPRYSFKKESISSLMTRDTLGHSLNSKQKLGFIDSNVPLLSGFYTAHTNHYPIRIKPDDIWLLIIQGFSNHVNENSSQLRQMFVEFEGKKSLSVSFALRDLNDVTKEHLEDFSNQIVENMKQFLGEELLDILTPNFTTTTYESMIVCKISIMGAFKKFFEYEMNLAGCGIPYIVLEGTAEDYKKIIEKANQLKEYLFDWYIERIIPHIQKMVDAKEGNIDKDYFKKMIQREEVTETRYRSSGRGSYKIKVDYINGWILDFFAYYTDNNNDISKFNEKSIKVADFNKIANQMLIVPFKISANGIQYSLKYKVGFVGCDQNSKNEVFPVQGWIVSSCTEEEENSVL